MSQHLYVREHYQLLKFEQYECGLVVGVSIIALFVCVLERLSSATGVMVTKSELLIWQIQMQHYCYTATICSDY